MAVNKHFFGTKAGGLIAASTLVLAAAGSIAAGLLGSVEPAVAQQGLGNFLGYQGPPRPKRYGVRKSRKEPSETADKAEKKTDTAEKKKDAKPAAPAGPVYAVISVGDQHVSIYDKSGRIARSRVSTGMAGHRTPTGVFSVIGKERWHHSNIYSGAPMPFMQRITWSGVAMHAGVVPGYPASHGCIRLPPSFAQQLFGMTKMGARVLISPRDVQPVEISHSFLPLPKMQPAPVLPANAQQASTGGEASIELASMGTHPAAGMTTAAVPDKTEAEATSPPKLVDPITYATALKIRAAADKTAADQAAKAALEAAQSAGNEARQAVEDVRKAAGEVTTAEGKLAAIQAPAAPKAADAQPSPTQGATAQSTAAADAAAAQAAAAARTAAQSELIGARAALDEARAREAAKSPVAFAAVETWKSAVAASEAAKTTLSESQRRVEPVSVLISRKEGRVFIRQDWKEVYEAPVTIRDPERPLGTHVYLAVDGAPDGSSMRWMAMSMPAAPVDDGDRRNRTKGKAEQPPAPPVAAETAAGALDRIELAPGVRERISELLWTGASLIVSDYPRSAEMDNDTDFVVETR